MGGGGEAETIEEQELAWTYQYMFMGDVLYGASAVGSVLLTDTKVFANEGEDFLGYV